MSARSGEGAPFEGLLQIVITPFQAEGAVDLPGVRRLVADAHQASARALTVLGVSSEAAFLSEEERRTVLDAVLRENAGELPFVVGVTGDTVELVARRAADAGELGAAAVMVAPTGTDVPPLERLAAVAAAAPGLDIVLQDFPGVGHPALPPEAIAAIAAAVPAVAAIYHEHPPTPAKVGQVLALAPGLPQIGGLGGLWLPWELRAGARGVMTGYAFPGLMAAIVDADLRGDRPEADRLHAIALPSIAWEAQPGVGVAHRKAMLVRRGVIGCAATRMPMPPTPRAAAEAESLASALEDRGGPGSAV